MEEVGKVVVGLGNPGLRYRKSRHNVGFIVINYIAGVNKVKFKKNPRLACKIAKLTLPKNNMVTLLVKPTTYMNRSGQAIGLVMKNLQIEEKKLLVIHDDIDLEFCKLRIKKNSSSGGHKGVASIIEHINSNKFLRLKVGVGRPKDPAVPMSDYLLSSFSKDEYKRLEIMLPYIEKVIYYLLEDELERAMNVINSIPPP